MVFFRSFEKEPHLLHRNASESVEAWVFNVESEQRRHWWLNGVPERSAPLPGGRSPAGGEQHPIRPDGTAVPQGDGETCVGMLDVHGRRTQADVHSGLLCCPDERADYRSRIIGGRKHPPVSLGFQGHAVLFEPGDCFPRPEAGKRSPEGFAAPRVELDEVPRIGLVMGDVAAATAGYAYF